MSVGYAVNYADTPFESNEKNAYMQLSVAKINKYQSTIITVIFLWFDEFTK